MKPRLVFALLIPLLVAAPATAAPFTPRANFAYRVARHYWSGFPNCTSVTRELVANDAIEREGEATMPLEPEPCFLKIAERLAGPRQFERMCAVMVHEGGHLHGLDHSPDPASIMYPNIDVMPPICLRAGERVINDHYTF